MRRKQSMKERYSFHIQRAVTRVPKKDKAKALLEKTVAKKVSNLMQDTLKAVRNSGNPTQTLSTWQEILLSKYTEGCCLWGQTPCLITCSGCKPGNF